MGSNISRPKQPNVPIPRYYPQGPPTPPMSGFPPYNISRSPSPLMPGMVDPTTLNRRQQRKLQEAQRTINGLQNEMAMMQRGRMGTPPPMPYGPPPMPYGPPSMPYGPPPMPYSRSPTMGRPSYPPPSPILRRYSGYHPYPQQMPMGQGAYRDSDYAAVANIAGLNPADIALLHREYTNLTRGGTSKIDRVVFRQLLREAMVEANNENVDRAIENIFISIDRNHDGFIDFPEFVGAFRDILRGVPNDPQQFSASHGLPDLINDQFRGNSFSSNICYPTQSSGQIISIPSSSVQQSPLIYNGASPLVLSLDSNQIPYTINSQGQSTALQCMPLPI